MSAVIQSSAGCKYSPHPYIIRRILRGLAKTAYSVAMLSTEYCEVHMPTVILMVLIVRDKIHIGT
jgi:hypothetical protein